MFVRVTTEDIETGEVGNALKCPLARALQRRTGDSYATVGYSGFSATKNGRWQFHRLSESGQMFVTNFDRGREVKPGIYWI